MATSSIPLFPLSSVLFPDGVLPLRVFEVRYLEMVNKCIAQGTQFGVVLLTRGSEVRTPEGAEILAKVGTMARIEESASPMPGLMEVLCRGTERFSIVSSERMRNGLWMAEVESMEPDRHVVVPAELSNVVDALHLFINALQGLPKNRMPLAAPYRLGECGWVANRWSELLAFTNEQKQSLLALDNPVIRLELVQDKLGEHGMLA